MIKTIVGSIVSIGAGGLHWLIEMTPILIAISTIIGIVVGISTIIYIWKVILKKNK